MQETHRPQAQTAWWHTLRGAWIWPALIFGLLLATLLWAKEVSSVMAVVFLLIGAAVLSILAWRGGQLKSRGSAGAALDEGDRYWQSWLSGWYWQTGPDHQLQVLKPDGDHDEWWLAAQRCLTRQDPIWALWAQHDIAALPAEQATSPRLPARGSRRTRAARHRSAARSPPGGSGTRHRRWRRGYAVGWGSAAYSTRLANRLGLDWRDVCAR